jgi:glutamate synthase (NADPH) large chain
MTGGVTIVIGSTGRNFAAGMSGGRAFVWDKDGDFRARCNPEMVDLEPLSEKEDIELVRDLLIQHAAYTGSTVVGRLLKRGKLTAGKFVKVMPRDYRRVLDEQKEAARALPSLELLQPVEVSRG